MAILPFRPYGFIYQGSLTGCTAPLMREFLWEETLNGWQNDMAASCVGINEDQTGRAPFGKVYPLPVAFDGAPLIFSAPIGAIQSFRYISNANNEETTAKFFIKNSNQTGTPVYAKVIVDPNAIYVTQFGISANMGISLQATWGAMLYINDAYNDTILAADGSSEIGVTLISGTNGKSQQSIQLCGNGDGAINNINNPFSILGLAQGFNQNASGDRFVHFNVTLANQWFNRSWPCSS